jgi:hypothetical protein
MDDKDIYLKTKPKTTTEPFYTDAPDNEAFSHNWDVIACELWRNKCPLHRIF